MPRVFKTNTVNIEKKDNLYKFIYENGEKFPTFFEKIKKNFNIEKEKKGSSFTIKAKTVEKLTELLKRKETLSYRHLTQLFLNVGKQLEGLEEDNYCNCF